MSSSDESDTNDHRFKFNALLEVTLVNEGNKKAKQSFECKSIGDASFVAVDASSRKLERLILSMPAAGVEYDVKAPRNQHIKTVCNQILQKKDAKFVALLIEKGGPAPDG